MYMRQGTVAPLTYTDRKVRSIIRFMGEIPFSPKIIRRKTDFHRNTVQSLIKNFTEKGFLKRLGRGQYIKTSLVLPVGGLPKSFIAQHVWEVLKDQGRFLTQPEIAVLASHSAEVDRVLINIGVAHVLYCWYRNGSLRRRGTCKYYAYKLKRGITKRPITSKRSFILPA